MITVTKTNTGESKSFMFSVVDPKVTLTQGESFMLIGSETKFEAITEYGKYGGQYTFRSTNASVASVDSDGLVKAKKAGTTTILIT